MAVMAAFLFLAIPDPLPAQQSPPIQPLTVIAAVPRSFPPQYLIDENQKPAGFAIDVMGRLARLAGLEVQYLVEDTWEAVFEAVRLDKAQIIPNLGVSPDREQGLDFTPPVETFEIALFVRTATSDVRGLDDLTSRRVGAANYSMASDFLRQRGVPPTALYGSYEEGLARLLSGDIDAYAAPVPVLLELARRARVDNLIKVAGPPLAEVKRAVAVRRGNPELLARLSQAVTTFAGSAEYQQMVAFWYGRPTPFWTPKRIAWALSGLFLAGLLAMALWRYLTVTRLNSQLLAAMAKHHKAEQMAAGLAAIVASSGESIIGVDLDGVITSWNRGAEQLFGYLAAETVGRHVSMLVPDGHRDRDMDYLQKALQGEDVSQYETTRLTKDGRLLELSITLSPLWDESGRQVGLSGISRDITERKKGERSLKDSEEKFAKLFRNSPVWISLSTLADGRYLDVNEAYLKGTGWSREEVLGRTSREIMLWVDEAQREQGLRLLEQDGHIREMPINFRKKSGEQVIATWSAERIEIGDTPCLVSVVNDITERKRAEDTIRESESKYRALIETTNTGFVILDVQGLVLDANQEYAHLTGHASPRELIGRSVLEWTHPDDRDCNRIEVEKCLERGFVRNLEMRYLLPNGESVSVEISATVLSEQEPKVILSLCRDISERNRAQEALRESESNLRSIFDTIQAGIIYGDASGNLLLFNQHMADMFGYSLAELMGLHYLKLTDPSQAAEATDRLRGLLTGDISHLVGERLYLKKDGTPFWGQLSASRMTHADGSFKALVGIIYDINARKQAESALKEREERHRALVEGSFDGIWVQKGTRIAFANQRMHQIMGYPEGELVGMEHWLLYHPDFRDMTRDRAQARLRGENPPYRYEVMAQRKDGSFFEAEVSAKAVTLEGEPSIQVWLRDISQRQRAEETLRQSEARFKALSEESPLGVSLIDEQGGYHYVNPAFVRMFGYTLSEIKTGADWFALAFPDEAYRSQVLKAWRDDLLGFPAGASRPRTFDVRCKDGSSKTIMFRPVTIAPHGQFVLYEDITERRQAEESLRRSEENYRLILEASPDPMVLYDMEGKVLYLNPAFTRVFGWTVEELIGRNIDYVPEDEWPQTRKMLEFMKQGQSTYGYETRRYDKQGNVLDIALSWSVWRDHGGNPAGSVITLRNVTEQKRLEAQLRQAQKMEAIGTMAGGIAHDFNNLLSVILGYAERAQDHALRGKGSSYEITQIVNAAQRAAQLVQQILTFSRRGKTVRQPIDLNREVEHVTEMLGRTIPKMISIETHLAPDLKLINGDVNQIELVLLNLANNAVDAMPEGGRLIIGTRNVELDEAYSHQHPEVEPGQFVVLEVSDTGTGMDETTSQHIFEPFYTTKGVGKGTGLGLSTVFGIAADHGGHVTCYSERGTGTTMRAYWPVHEGEPAQASRRHTALPEKQLRGSERILLVDDEEALRNMAADALARMGYVVFTAENGEEALDLYREMSDRLDLVILDLGMPGMGGRKCLKEILALNPRAKVLIASGYAVNGIQDEALGEGASGFLAKPFRVAELLAMARSVLDKN
jgi:PAS domain S-box-containing protein